LYCIEGIVLVSQDCLDAASVLLGFSMQHIVLLSAFAWFSS